MTPDCFYYIHIIYLLPLISTLFDKFPIVWGEQLYFNMSKSTYFIIVLICQNARFLAAFPFLDMYFAIGVTVLYMCKHGAAWCSVKSTWLVVGGYLSVVSSSQQRLPLFHWAKNFTLIVWNWLVPGTDSIVIYILSKHCLFHNRTEMN